MNARRTILIAGAAGSVLALSAITGHAAEPVNPYDPTNPSQPLYHPGTSEPHDADASNHDRGWIEQVRDWWNSDQGETHAVTGTIVDLETYLINGEEVARQQSGSASLYDSDPVALLTDDGDLYVLLDRYEQRHTSTDTIGFNDRDADPVALSGANKAGEQRDDVKTDDRPSLRLTAGQTITLTGNVYDRNGIKGLLVSGYAIDSPFSADVEQHRSDKMMGHDNMMQHGDRATPRPSDAQDKADAERPTNASADTNPNQDRAVPRPSDENAQQQ